VSAIVLKTGFAPDSLMGDDSRMDTPTQTRVILDGLYRRRWWTSAVLCIVLVFVLDGDPGASLLTSVVFGLLALLLWLPVIFRWAMRVRAAGRSFREGLSGK